jgi:hypothetical protein
MAFYEKHFGASCEIRVHPVSFIRFPRRKVEGGDEWRLNAFLIELLKSVDEETGYGF